MIREIKKSATNGFLALILIPAGFLGCGYGIYQAASVENWLMIPVLIFLILCLIICLSGFFMVNPNEGRVLQLFGSYVGTVMKPGLRWANPLYSKNGFPYGFATSRPRN